MNKEIENIDELLGKYLSGEASESEATRVDEWLSHSEENQRYFAQLAKIFNGAAAMKEWSDYDTDAAWLKVKGNLRKKSAPVIPLSHNDRKKSIQWWKVAAAVLLMLSAGLYLYLSSEKTAPLEVVAEHQVLGDTLPDGSNVFLNKETRIVYAFDKKTKTHDVKLKGEAYFSINHSDKEQFMVDAGGVFIKDIGTSFNVRAYPDSDEVEVLVEEGEVIFFTSDNPGIRLKESGKAIYNKKTKQFKIDAPDPNIVAYKTKFFVFSNTTLGEAAEALNQVYETPLAVPDHLKQCAITVSFRNEGIDEIAAIIGETLSLTVTKEKDRIVLNGDACE